MSDIDLDKLKSLSLGSRKRTRVMTTETPTSEVTTTEHSDGQTDVHIKMKTYEAKVGTE